jgi:acyl-CoA synthetase (AMP-forming)/AMP-acid ligase II
MSTLAEIEARLTAPGAPFETAVEPVLGEPMPVFKQRARSLVEVLAASRGHGAAEYLVCDGVRLSYAEHVRRVASVAKGMRERFGVGPGDRVAILAANGPEWITSYWAALSLGAIAVGMNAWWSGDEIAFALADCEPRLLLADRKRLARLRGPAPLPVVEIESDFAKLWDHDPAAELPEVPLHEDDPATILYTSGTTGRPKGAVNTHRGILSFVRASLFHGARMLMWSAARGAASAAPALPTCMFVNTPLFHVSGLYSGAVIPLATGIKTVWTRQRFDPAHVMQTIEAERVTNWGPMGTMVHRVARHPDRGRFDLSSVRNVGSGGAPVGPELLSLMREVFPNARASVGVGYGLTESTSGIAMIFGEELEERPGCVGRALPTVSFEIRDEQGRPVPEGVEGEIHVRGPQVMREYWRRPQESAEAILPGRWLRTGDWGRLEQGYLYVNSRKRDLILRGGENVYPAEIEQCLETHPGVREAAVLGVDHPELGQEVKAIVVPMEGAAPDPHELARFVAARLAYFKVPAHFELRPEALPRNAAGKVLKNLLRDGGESPFLDE